MLDVLILLQTWDRLHSWVSSFNSSTSDNREQYDAALNAIYTAANETRLYLASLKRGGRQNKDTEASLSRMWQSAAISLRTIDADLSSRCLFKSTYWVDPESWSPSQIKKARINLDSMYRDARKFLYR